MTLYRLYLRSHIRRELLPPRRSRREPAVSLPPLAGREECPCMICGGCCYSYAINGTEEFEAQDDAAALAIARIIFDAAGDLCDAFELWDGTRQIDQNRMATLRTTMITAQWQEHVLRAEEALLSSGWAIARSRRLLARFNEMRGEATSRPPVSPVSSAPTQY